MDQAPDNPVTNQIGQGLTEDQVRAAVEKSGYPLQTIVCGILRAKPDGDHAKFSVREEWSFVDRDTKELRNIDALAELWLYDSNLNPHPRVRPMLNLLVECRQSNLPYVFFLAPRGPGWLMDSPSIAGLRTDRVRIATDDESTPYRLTVIHALDLGGDPFQKTPAFCHTLSKCVRKGSDVELSGSEPYNGLVLPLVKALEHFIRIEEPTATTWAFDCHIALGIAVLDAPMIGVSAGPTGPTLKAIPWLRLMRHEYAEKSERHDRSQLWALEIVHKDFFSAYLDQHLIPFARRFAERVLRHQTELATGLAFVSRMHTDPSPDIEGRLRPRSETKSPARATLARNVMRFLTGRRGPC